MMPDVCAVCGKIVARFEACEGEKVFHLDCYVLYKRQARTRGQSRSG
jgi:hypothetical protein